MIWARNHLKALRLLEEVPISAGPSDVESIGLDTWKVCFGPDVFIEIATPSAHQARLTAEWILYLDKRSRKPQS
jgi:hypothetical protein